jgi:hypothetical protein
MSNETVDIVTEAPVVGFGQSVQRPAADGELRPAIKRLCEFAESIGVNKVAIDEVNGPALLDTVHPTPTEDVVILLWLLTNFPRPGSPSFVVAGIQISNALF